MSLKRGGLCDDFIDGAPQNAFPNLTKLTHALLSLVRPLPSAGGGGGGRSGPHLSR